MKDNKTKDGSAEKAYEKLSDSVVSIAVYDKGETPDTNEPTSEGTGIIISDEGHIVTNSHVVFDDLDSNVINYIDKFLLLLEKSLCFVVEIDLPCIPCVALAYFLIFIFETYLVEELVCLLT